MINVLCILVLSVIAAVLGAMGGAEHLNKNFRRVGVPIVTSILGLIVLRSLWSIMLMARSAALSLGYGPPDPTDPKPSALGAFWYKIWKGNLKLTNIFTRMTVGITECITMITIAILTGNWLLYCIASLFIIANHITFGAIVTGEGTYTLFGKTLLKEESYLHGGNTLILGFLMFFSKILHHV
jgi:hypothetical protein